MIGPLRNCDSVRNHLDVVTAKPLLYEPFANGVAVRNDAVGKAARHGLSDPLHLVAVREHAHVPHRCNRDAIRAQGGGQNSEEVRVKAISMDDLDSFTANVTDQCQSSAQSK